MARFLSEEATSEEKAELSHLLETEPDLRQQFDILISLWGEHRIAEEEELDEDSARTAVSHILYLSENADPNERRDNVPPALGSKRRSLKKWWLAAASVAAILVLFLVIRWSSAPQATAAPAVSQAAETVSSQKGSRTRTLLPDGSTVWLNAGSKLEYVNNFEGATREVRLEGEGYFDITRNPEKPFIVHTANINIRVLGTAFNVKSYPDDQTVETTLFHGLVEISREADTKTKPILLRPLEKISIPVTGQLESRGTVSKEPSTISDGKEAEYRINRIDSLSSQEKYIETAWVYNRLEFRGDNFEELARKLERWYNIRIVFQDEQVRQLRFNGSLESETAEQAFRALKEAIPFTYKLSGHDVYIKSPQ